MRASIYARISSDREGAGLGVATQEADCRELADRLGWLVVSVHTDNDVSAYSGKPRPGYRALLDEIRAGKIDAVLAWHTDRLHRNPAELEDYIRACERHGVTTHTVKAGHLDLSTSTGLLIARQLGNLARYEVDHMAERQRRAKLRSAEAGKWKGGRRPFGYAADGVTIVEREADAIRRGAAAVLAGESLRSVAREWNAAGITTATGKQWDMGSVRAVLLRPRNAGLMEHRGEIVGPAEWPAVLPEEQWRAVVGILTDPARKTTPGPARKWLGSGIYRCAECAEPVIGARAADGRQIYRCRRGCVARGLEEVDEYVSAHVVAYLRRPDLADLLALPGDEVDVSALEQHAVTLRTRLDQLGEMFGRGEIDAQTLTAGSRAITAELESTRQQIADAYAGTALAGVAEAPDPGQAWLRAPLDRKRAVLDLLMTVTLLKAPRGRPPGWKPGDTYFRPETVRIEPRGRGDG